MESRLSKVREAEAKVVESERLTTAASAAVKAREVNVQQAEASLQDRERKVRIIIVRTFCHQIAQLLLTVWPAISQGLAKCLSCLS
jgi:hypothetical protein